MLTASLPLALVASLPLPPVAQGGGFESFDEVGSSWSNTFFPNEQIFGDGIFVREALGPGLGAPTTNPPLPINQGGDKEGRYFEQTLAGTHCTTFSEEVLCDVLVDGYLAIGFPDPFGGRNVGFILRSGSTPLPTAYVAEIAHNSGTTARLHISLMCNHLIHASTVLASSEPFPVDLSNENYRLAFRAAGTQLTAELWRVSVSGGSILEEPIDLLAASGIQNVLSATDGTLVQGSVGVFAFARGDNSVFFDDVQVTDLACGPGIAYCFGDGAAEPCPCGNFTQSGEGCRNSNGVGARLASQGTPSVSANDLRLGASQVPRNIPGILFAGTAAVNLPFGDGLRCVGGIIVRLPSQNSGACGVLLQDDLVPQVGIGAGQTWRFQGWFRDVGGPCGTSFNLTHGLEVSFTP